jgi:zinc protease
VTFELSFAVMYVSETARMKEQRMNKGTFLFAVVLCAVLAATVAVRTEAANEHETIKLPVLHYEKYKLPNGLDVILSEDHTLPLVSVNLCYHVGPANERRGRTGFAHLFEHMMFQGSEHVGAKAHFRYLEAAGASGINGTTEFDRTNYFETVPANQLELALWLESDRMGYLLPTLDQAKLANQRDVVRNERRQTTENVPYGLVEEQLYHQLFPEGHPYYASVIGSHRDIEAARVGDVREFFREYYAPNNASLAIVGDFDAKQIRALVAKYFRTLPAGPPVPKIEVVTPPITSERRAVVTDRVELPRVYLAWITAPIFKPGDAESGLLAEILGGGKTSRLYRKLVYDQQIAQSVSVENDSKMLGSVLTITATAKPGVKPEDLETAIESEVETLRREGPTKEELERAVNLTEADAVRSLERFGAVANRLNEYNHYLGDPGYLARDLGRYERATTADLRRVAEEELKPNARVVVYGLPGKKVVDDVRKTRRDEEAKEATPESAAVTAPKEPWRNTAPKPGLAIRFVPPVPAEFTLANGLKVFLVERHTLPVVAANLVVLGGVEANPAGKPGLASFTADMLEEGTKKRTSPELAAEIEQIGAVLETSSSYDSVSVSLRTLSRTTEQGFVLFSDMALDPSFDAKEIARQRSQRLTALVEDGDRPSVVRTKVLNHVLFGDTVYGYTSIGTEASNLAITRDDLEGFWKGAFVPSNAALVVAGDIRQRELRKLAEKCFGDWSGEAFHSTPPVVARDPKRAIYIVDKPGAPQTSLAVATIGPPRSTPDYVALEVLNMVFGGQFASRINMNLREDHGYAYGAHSSFAFRRGAGPFSAYSGIRTDVTAPAVREIFREVERIRDSEVSPEELQLAKNGWALSLAGDFQTAGSVAATEAELFVYGLPLDYYRGLGARIDAVSASEIRRMAQKYLDPESLVVIAVGDRARIGPELEQLNLGPVKQVP